MAITTPGDKKPVIPTAPSSRNPPLHIQPVERPPKQFGYQRISQEELMTPFAQHKFETELFPHMQPVDNFALSRNTDRSHDYSVACSDEGFSFAPAKYLTLLKEGFAGFNAYPGIKTALDFVLQSHVYSFRDIFLSVIDSRTTYYSNDVKADMPNDFVAELCRVNSYSVHLNARVMYEVVKLYNEFCHHVTNHRADTPASKTLKEHTMPASTKSPASDSTTPSSIDSTTTESNSMNTNQAQEHAVEAASTAADAVNNAADATNAATEKLLSRGNIMDKSKLFAKKAVDGVSNGVVIGSTALVAGEVLFFSYQTARGRDYQIGDGMRAVGGLFARKVVVVADEVQS